MVSVSLRPVPQVSPFETAKVIVSRALAMLCQQINGAHEITGVSDWWARLHPQYIH